MAGTIIADTLTHSTAGSVTTDYVVNGSAKAWCNFNGQGTVAFRNSLNCTSLVDNGTGDYELSYVSNLVDVGYSISFNSASNGGSRAGTFIGSKVTAVGTPNAIAGSYIRTSGHSFQCAYGADASNNGGASNPDAVCLDINGDLA
jgi:hypothetical protein